GGRLDVHLPVRFRRVQAGQCRGLARRCVREAETRILGLDQDSHLMQTPTGRIVAAAQESIIVIDAQGRKLAVRRLDAVGKLRLFKALGPALAQNEPYLGMALLASSVSSIDDVPCPAAVTEILIESTVRQLGE